MTDLDFTLFGNGEMEMNLRFDMVVAGALVPGLLYYVPKANAMIREKERYSEQERFDFACRIMDFMRRRSRTETIVYGMKNIPEDEKLILYSNHQGKYDALGILLALDRPCGVLWEKRQARRIMSRQVGGLIGAVPIDLDDMRDKVAAIAEVTGRVKAGKNMLIFPEGGYTDNGNRLQEFNTGCFHCALRSKATIVPVVIYDSHKAMNSNSLRKVTTQVHFLPPIPFAAYGKLKKPELAEMVKARISEKLGEIRRYDSLGQAFPGKPDRLL